MLEQWMHSYRPEQLFDKNGRLDPELAALAPKGDRRMAANPHVNGGKLIVNLDLPDFRRYAIPVTKPATERHESTRQLGKIIAIDDHVASDGRVMEVLSEHLCQGWLEG
jgi:xylulose-5-phosphate/fructose-6-phosphate phosphoketolase